MTKEELEKKINMNLDHLDIFIAREMHLREWVGKNNALIPTPIREELDRCLEIRKYCTKLIQQGRKQLALLT